MIRHMISEIVRPHKFLAAPVHIAFVVSDAGMVLHVPNVIAPEVEGRATARNFASVVPSVVMCALVTAAGRRVVEGSSATSVFAGERPYAQVLVFVSDEMTAATANCCALWVRTRIQLLRHHGCFHWPCLLSLRFDDITASTAFTGENLLCAQTGWRIRYS